MIVSGQSLAADVRRRPAPMTRMMPLPEIVALVVVDATNRAHEDQILPQAAEIAAVIVVLAQPLVLEQPEQVLEPLQLAVVEVVVEERAAAGMATGSKVDK